MGGEEGETACGQLLRRWISEGGLGKEVSVGGEVGDPGERFVLVARTAPEGTRHMGQLRELDLYANKGGGWYPA